MYNNILIKQTGGETGAVQHLYPLELNCDIAQTSQTLNAEAAEYHLRAARDAATAARTRIEQIADIGQTS